jgi:hypothetical protein
MDLLPDGLGNFRVAEHGDMSTVLMGQEPPRFRRMCLRDEPLHDDAGVNHDIDRRR